MTVRVRVKLGQGEIEVEGSEQFVREQLQELQSLLRSSPRLREDATPREMKEDPQGKTREGFQDTSSPQGTFGEWMHGFPDGLSDLDKALVAAYFVQRNSDKNEFKTSQINHLLQEHGVKLSNPSVCLGRLVKKKLMFQTRKEGKLKFLRVSNEGEKHMESLRSASEDE